MIDITITISIITLVTVLRNYISVLLSKLLSEAYNVLVLNFFSYSSTGPDKAGVNVIGLNLSFSCTHWFVAKCK